MQRMAAASRRMATTVYALACVMLPSAPAATQPTGSGQARDAAILARFPPPGQLVDVGGRRLHILCKGPTGGPTVMFETGAAASSLYYWKAQDEVARFARACVYDRAGLGWSDPAPFPRTLEDRANDLHALLQAARLKGPYVLAGHSAGGLIVQLYARKWPRDLKGAVLIESSEIGFNGDAENTARTAATARQMGMAVAAAEAGREVSQLRLPGGPPEQEVALRAEVFRTGQDDLSAMSKLAEEGAKFGPLGDMPLVVVSRGKPDAGFTEAQSQGWEQAQARLAALSTHSTRMVAANSGHNVPNDEPTVVAEAVRRILQPR